MSVEKTVRFGIKKIVLFLSQNKKICYCPNQTVFSVQLLGIRSMWISFCFSVISQEWFAAFSVIRINGKIYNREGREEILCKMNCTIL